jgi:hypothetical protein
MTCEATSDGVKQARESSIAKGGQKLVGHDAGGQYASEGGTNVIWRYD